MKLIRIILTVTSLVSANPLKPMSISDDSIYTANNTCYIAEHNVVSVHLPFLNEPQIYFVQGDLTNNTFYGIYRLIFDLKNDHFSNVTATKLLDNGTCITSDEETVYFGSTDGIFVYKNNTVERFGSVSANIRDIQKVKGTDLLYIVTDDDKLYVVTENGNKMVEHDIIKNVHEIALDGENNLYFYEKHNDPDRYLMYHERYLKPKVLVEGRVLNISGLPDEYAHIRLGNAMGDVIVMLGHYYYMLHSNGTSTDMRAGFVEIPTAYSLELGLFQVYSSGQKLYCISVIEMIGKALGKALTAANEAFGKAIKEFFEAIASNLQIS